MKKLIVLFLISFIFIGCSSRGINIYIPTKDYKYLTNIKVYDKRKDPQLIGYIYSNSKIVADITLSTDISKLIKEEIAKRGLKKSLEIYIEKLFVNYNRSKIAKENTKAIFIAKIIFYKNGHKISKTIKIEESKWINPIKSSKLLGEFIKNIIAEGVNTILETI